MRPSLRVLWPCNGPLSLAGREEHHVEIQSEVPTLTLVGLFSVVTYALHISPYENLARPAPSLARSSIFSERGIYGALINVTYNKDLGGLFCNVGYS